MIFASLKRWSLAKRLILPANVISIVLISGLAVRMIHKNRIEAETAMESKIQLLGQSVRMSSGSFIWNMEKAALESLATEIAKDPDVNAVAFFEKDGRSITQVGQWQAGKESWKRSFDIKLRDEVIGKFVLEYNQDRVEQTVRSSTIEIVGTMLIYQLILGLALLLVIRRATGLLLNGTDKLRSSALETVRTSETLEQTSKTLSHSTNDQASAIEETTRILEEINSKAEISVASATRSVELGEGSLQVAREGKHAVDEMIRSINDISQSNHQLFHQVEVTNDKITEISNVIQDIANKTKIINDIVFQTKLLSFNASVEAARAGEHGRGFAVVAEEVGNLAAMSGKASHEIAEMLQQSVRRVEEIVAETKLSVNQAVDSGKAKVEEGIQTAERCGEILEQVVENVSQVSSLIGEISAASKEQASGVQNITLAMNQIDKATHDGSRSADDAAQAVVVLARQSESLHEIIESFEASISGEDKKIKKAA